MSSPLTLDREPPLTLAQTRAAIYYDAGEPLPPEVRRDLEAEVGDILERYALCHHGLELYAKIRQEQAIYRYGGGSWRRRVMVDGDPLD